VRSHAAIAADACVTFDSVVFSDILWPLAPALPQSLPPPPSGAAPSSGTNYSYNRVGLITVRSRDDADVGTPTWITSLQGLKALTLAALASFAVPLALTLSAVVIGMRGISQHAHAAARVA
jgi:hypothetical protein